VNDTAYAADRTAGRGSSESSMPSTNRVGRNSRGFSAVFESATA
jgi:hypothetical protein